MYYNKEYTNKIMYEKFNTCINYYEMVKGLYKGRNTLRIIFSQICKIINKLVAAHESLVYFLVDNLKVFLYLKNNRLRACLY